LWMKEEEHCAECCQQDERLTGVHSVLLLLMDDDAVECSKIIDQKEALWHADRSRL